MLGCGYTGRRVAREWLNRGGRVIATSRTPERLHHLERSGAELLRLDALDPDSLDRLSRHVPNQGVVLHSIPVVHDGVRNLDPTPRLLQALDSKPSRVVYFSTTGVYGPTEFVDHTTRVAPDSERVQLRADAEMRIAELPLSNLILRPAAIYGPFRGVHASMRKGTFRLAGDGANYISRIHVEDLTQITVSALRSQLGGAYPVADLNPCPSAEIARFCAELLNVPLPAVVERGHLSETRRSNRRVDGSEIRRLLGVPLAYPTYREGIPAALESERTDIAYILERNAEF